MKKIILLLLCGIMICAVFTGCSQNSTSVSPQDAIADAYGDTEYKISFMSEGLSTPIESITYTANKMPVLPTPEKIGYIFSGWYFDKEYTIPYVDGILYLYMRDVTLYAKWEKESFATNGTYDLEYSAKILEDTVVKGSFTDEGGGYMDFTESLIAEEIYLEKSDGKLLLRLQYDTKYLLPMFNSVGEVYSVTVSSRMGTSVYIEDKVHSLADPVKTIFINLTDFNLEDTLYLDIQTVNWANDELSDSERINTLTRYTVAIDFTKIIGFSRAYVNTEVPLEKGYYLVKSYYRKENNGTTMADSFNPVYSYLYSDGNENYTLIKQNIPYAGLTSNSGLTIENTADNYYNRMMSLIPIQLFYEITNPPEGNEEVESDYYPATYGGQYYGAYAMEYHADTGKFYNIYNLGSNLKSSYIVMNAVTGFMEIASGMGYNDLILEIDYDHIIKLATVDYEPLTGDSFQYQTDMQYYPGNSKDLSNKNMCYELMTDGGLSTDMINFFYSTLDSMLPTTSRTQYSSRITVTPTVGTNANKVADSRYMMAYFDVNAQVFGYDHTSEEKLYADSMTVQSMGISGMRRDIEINVGKSCTVGETIRLAEIYAEKCDATTDFPSVTWTAYAMKNGKADYSNKLNIGNVFTFSESVAILFETKTDTGTRRTLVELAEYEAPDITIKSSENFPYDANAEYAVGDTVGYPNVSYDWMGKSADMIGTFFADPTAQEIDYSINIVKTALFEDANGVYYWCGYGKYNDTTFEVPAEKFIVVYELENKYGEKYYHAVHFVCNSRLDYFVENSAGDILETDGVRYDAEGARRAISTTLQSERLTAENYKELLFETYFLRIGDFTKDYTIYNYTLYTDTITEEEILINEDQNTAIEDIWKKIDGSKYAVLELVHRFGDDSVIATYYYNLNFAGKHSTEMLDCEDYFVGHEYAFSTPALYDAEGNRIAGGYAYCGERGSTVVRDYYQYRVTFSQAGDYTLHQRYNFDGLTLTFSQKIHIWNNNVDVTVTYVTDAAHPFDDGTLERTVTYNLTENMYAMKKAGFADSIPVSDVLYGWTMNEGSYSIVVGGGKLFEDFISTFNSRNVTLYTVWDPGLTLTINRGDGTSYKKTYYIGSQGNYQISGGDFKATVPDGYQLAGWECGLFDGVRKQTYYYIRPAKVDWDNPDSFVLNPVFKKELTVKYSVDTNYTDAFFRNETVLEGNCVVSSSNKIHVNCKVDGYEFAGWYVQGDETKTVIDLETYVITENTTLVAKFVPVED